ncbi:MAG: hypothetical protein LUE98_02325 [Tannerellaceae bacterium]|nr:hypothetical protein [Tannerellaceae bacterium]
MRNIKYIAFLLLLSFHITGQNQLTSSPYSMYGVGEVVSGLYGQNAAMGGVSYGMRDNWLINIGNPAGLVGMDSAKIYAESSLFLENNWYSSGDNKHKAFTGNLSSFLLGGRIMPRVYMAAGLAPYSAVGYYFRGQSEVEGAPGSYVTSIYQGDGGLSKAFLSTGVLLPYNFSFGVNLNYYFGSVTMYESQSNMEYKTGFDANLFHADFGLQYDRAIGKNTALRIGLVYGYRHKYKLSNFKNVTGSTFSSEIKVKNQTQYLPEFYGVGFGLQHKKMTYALDYTFRRNSLLSTNISRVKYQDIHEFRSGICLDPGGREFESYWKQVKYKAGIDVSTPSYTIAGKSGISWRASTGMALPMFQGVLNTGIYYDYTLISGHLQQYSVGMTVSFTLSERMFRVKL